MTEFGRSQISAKTYQVCNPELPDMAERLKYQEEMERQLSDSHGRNIEHRSWPER